MALNRLAADNPTHASMVTLNAITQNIYMDDLLFAGDTLSNVETFARKGIEVFESRGFKLRKWVTNGHAKSVLLQVPQCDHAPSVGKIEIGSQTLPDSTALGLCLDPEQGRTQGGVLGVQTPPMGLLTKMHSKENITFLALLSLFFAMTRTPT